MTTQISRRTLARGAAWSAPAVAIAASSPALAASPACTADAQAAIDKAFTDATAALRCPDGSPIKLELNFYQPSALADGYGQEVYTNVKNLSTCDYNFTADNPLHLDVQVRSQNPVGTFRRSIVRVATSWGSGAWDATPTLTGTKGEVHHDIDWTFTGLLPGTAGGGDNEADLVIAFGDGATGQGRLTNYLTVTPQINSGAPTLDSIIADNPTLDIAACSAYYDSVSASWVSPIQWSYSGPLSSGSLAAGSTLDSRVSGNYPTRLLADRYNGIF